MKDLPELAHPISTVFPWRSATESDTETNLNVSTESRSGNATNSPAFPSDVRPEVLTNEERIRCLLDDAGGAARQTALVEAADWSKSTVSRVLCRMEEEDSVVRYMIGGQNVVYLPGHEPDAFAADPFDDAASER